MTPKLIASDLLQPGIAKRKWPLEEGLTLKLGSRVPAGQMLVEWDSEIANRQAEVTWQHGRLLVRRLPEDTAEQPIYYAGREADTFQIIPGEGFVIGNTAFRLAQMTDEATSLVDSSAPDISPPLKTNTIVFHPTDDQIGFIRRLLGFYESLDPDLFAKEVQNAVQEAIPSAHQVSLLKVLTKNDKKHWEIFGGSPTGPDEICEELVYEACREDEYKACCWADQRSPQPFPPVKGMQWAVCMPVVSNKDEEEGELALYIAGKRAVEVRGVKKWDVSNDQQVFLHIVARILSGARTIDDLRRCRSWMQEFFPRPIRNLIYRKDPEDVFRSEAAEVAVLFCDLRGSCHVAERGCDELKESWQRLQRALAVMTQAITDRRGAIGDFQGDAAMGFWGWPAAQGGSQDLKESVRDACNAANTLRERFTQREQEDSGLSGMKCGIGVAAGPVWAGMLGTHDQRKIGVFGPVVNLAARLETMTKQLGVSILLDEAARDLLKQADEGLSQQTRYLAKVVPAGMEKPIKVFELMPSAEQQTLQRANLKKFREGRDAVFERRDWQLARKFLEPLRSSDGPARFLLEQMHEQVRPPDDWDGAFWLTKK
jgi:adenylate cyclase